MQNRQASMKMRGQQGFTLIELMIVAAVVAILTAIAYPSYRDHVQKTKRAECQGVMMAASGVFERHYAVTNKYNGATGLPMQCPVGAGATPSYNLAYVNPDVAVGVVPHFTITATPTGSQSSDKCGVLTLNYQGIKGQNGSTATDKDCWK